MRHWGLASCRWEVTTRRCEVSRSHWVCPTRRCVSSRRRWVLSRNRWMHPLGRWRPAIRRSACDSRALGDDTLYDLRRLVNTIKAELRRKRAGRALKRGIARQLGHHPRQARHGQSIGMKRSRADTEGLDSIAMVILVAKVCDHSLRTARQGGGRKGAGTPMVNDRHHSGKEKVVRNAGNRETRPPGRGRAGRWRCWKQS